MVKTPNNRFNRTAPFVTVCAARFARLRTNRANPLRGTGLPVKRMFCGRFARGIGDSMISKNISIFDLVFAHYIYKHLTQYDDSLSELFRVTEKRIDFTKKDHVLSLLIWLNKWGCRNISKKSYVNLVSELTNWWESKYEIIYNGIFSKENVIELFDSLSQIVVSTNDIKTIHFGPTATSKTLFAIFPKHFIPWDKKIREEYMDCGIGYYSYLYDSLEMIKSIKKECREKKIKWETVKNEEFKGYISDLKLIDEFMWVIKSNAFQINKNEITSMCRY